MAGEEAEEAPWEQPSGTANSAEETAQTTNPGEDSDDTGGSGDDDDEEEGDDKGEDRNEEGVKLTHRQRKKKEAAEKFAKTMELDALMNSDAKFAMGRGAQIASRFTNTPV